MPRELNSIPNNVSFLGYDMINYLKNDSSLTQDDVFVKESQVNHHNPVNHRSPAANDDCHYPECRTRYSFHAEFDGCLTVQKGQILFLQRHNNDGWSLGNGFDFYIVDDRTRAAKISEPRTGRGLARTKYEPEHLEPVQLFRCAWNPGRANLIACTPYSNP